MLASYWLAHQYWPSCGIVVDDDATDDDDDDDGAFVSD